MATAPPPPPPKADKPKEQPKPEAKAPETKPPWEEEQQEQKQSEQPKEPPKQQEQTQAPPKNQGKGNIELGFKKAQPKHTGRGIVLYAVEKWGKTTFGAYAPDVGMVLAPREEGYYTLLDVDLVPEIDVIEIANYEQLLHFTRSLVKAQNIPRNIVFDALGGFQQITWEHTCNREFNGDWGKRGWLNYNQGPVIAQNDWMFWLNELDKVRARGSNIILLGHANIKTFQNPEGADFSRYQCDVHEKTWSPLHRWADAILFGTFLTVSTEKDATKKGKGIGKDKRVVYTKRRDAFDAGNRLNMPERIELPEDPKKNWEAITKHIPGM